MKEQIMVWTGCYDAGWKGLITDESFAHPAKFSRNLIGRIYRHMLERGWLAPGMSVVDPFGGVALGALDAMANGLHWCGCELEPKFHALGNANIAEWVRRYGHSAGWGSARLLNGDSRRLCEVVGGADCVVGSPPFLESLGDKPSAGLLAGSGGRMGVSQKNDDGYGQSPGQLGGMKAGSVDAVLSSPPYAGTSPEANGSGPDKAKQYETYRKSGGGASFEAFCATQAKHSQGYGTAPGSLGNLRPGSVEAVVSSPPFEGVAQGTDGSFRELRAAWNADPKNAGKPGYRPAQTGVYECPSTHDSYGVSQGQLGNSTGETFWHAAREIVQQCHAILRPGGIAAWVTKDFVRNKARVPFSADWLKLCEACGFELVEWVKASLVKDLGRHADLYGDVHHKKVERKSFFRRLAEKKGSPRIDHEDVLFVRKG